MRVLTILKISALRLERKVDSRVVVGPMAQGRSNTAMSQRLVLSEKTVEAHIRTILTKLNLAATADDNRRVRAVLTYLSTSP